MQQSFQKPEGIISQKEGMLEAITIQELAQRTGAAAPWPI